jgi:hypothetical protein
VKRLTFSLAVVVALVVACTRGATPTGPTSSLTGQATTATAAALASTTTQTTSPPPVAVNEEARDGTFAFTVMVVTTEDSVGAGDEKIYPQGVFVWITMYVKNVGTSQQRYFADYQRLRDTGGRLFSPNLAAANEGHDRSDQVDVNPGNRTGAYLCFDVPKGTRPSQYVLLLHASPGSPGVTVRLPDSYHY